MFLLQARAAHSLRRGAPGWRRAYVFFLVFTNSLSENILDSDVVCKAMQIGQVALTVVVQGCPPGPVSRRGSRSGGLAQFSIRVGPSP